VDFFTQAPTKTGFRTQGFVYNPDSPNVDKLKPRILNTYVGNQTGETHWKFEFAVPPDKITTIQPLIYGTEPCQSTFNNWQIWTIEPPENASDPYVFTMGFGPTPVADAKDGAYTLTLRDEIGQEFTYTVYVNNGNPPVCPSPTPTPSPEPTTTPPGGGNGGNNGGGGNGGNGGNNGGGGNNKDPGGPDLDEPNEEECPCQQDGFGIQTSEGPTCPPSCSEEAKIKSKPCNLKAYDPRTRQLIDPPVEDMNIRFHGAYDFDRRQVNSKSEPANTRDIELVFVISKYWHKPKSGQKYDFYFAGDKFRQQITINNQQALVNKPGSEKSLDAASTNYKDGFRRDHITDGIYNDNPISIKQFFDYEQVPGFPKELKKDQALLLVSANLSKLPRQEQVISVQLPSIDKKILFETRLKLTPAASGSNKNWEEITCVD
jgi:hypothetical protein